MWQHNSTVICFLSESACVCTSRYAHYSCAIMYMSVCKSWNSVHLCVCMKQVQRTFVMVLSLRLSLFSCRNDSLCWPSIHAFSSLRSFAALFAAFPSFCTSPFSTLTLGFCFFFSFQNKHREQRINQRKLQTRWTVMRLRDKKTDGACT